MTALAYFLALVVLGQAMAEVVDLSCSDNATCIENLTKEFARNLRQKKTVRLFDTLTVEPLNRARQARSHQSPLARFLEGHAFSLDLSDYSFRLSKPEQRNDALELEVFEGRSSKEVAEKVPKKSISSSSKVEEDDEEEKLPKRLRRRHRKKVLQALIPMFFGMKSAAIVIFAMTVVTVLTLKAFVASKLALIVTVGMALKRLYENYGTGIPATSNVLWTLARYFRILFGLPELPSLIPEHTMTVPMYQVPMQMPTMQQMYAPMAMQQQPA